MNVFSILLVAALPFTSSQDVFTPGVGPTNEVAIALKVQPTNNLSLVEAVVDGVKATLLFDTGASHTTFDRAFVEKNLPAKKLEPIMLVGNTNVRAVPSSFHLDSLRLGEAVFGDFEAMAVPLGHLGASVGHPVDGILGMNVIRACPTLVSIGRGKAVLNPRRTDLALKGRSCTALQSSLVPRLAVAIPSSATNRPSATVLVDSGCSFTFLSSDLWSPTTNALAISASDVNGTGKVRPVRGVRGTIDLGRPVEIEPLLLKNTPNILGADTLLRYDIFFAWPSVYFLPQ